jgi:hypothetical protein
VGVGIANPQRALEVAGDLVVSGTISGGAGMGAFRNRIINGDMRIAQRGVSNVLVSNGGYNGAYLIDRWSIGYNITTGSVTQFQSALAASDAPYQLGLRNYMNVYINSSCSNYTYIQPSQAIEGYNIQDFNWGTSFGSPVTLSFWFRSNAPSGSVLNIGLRNYNISTSFIAPFTVANSGTWQYYTVTIPAPPNGTSFNTGASGALEVVFACAGLTQSSTGWIASTSLGYTGSYNWPGLAGNFIHFTGVQLEKGTVATPFEFRPYAQELALCQRYYFATASPPTGNFVGTVRDLAYNSNTFNTSLRFAQPMRTTAYTISVYNNGVQNQFRNSQTSGLVTLGGTFTLYGTPSVIGVAGFYYTAPTGLTAGTQYDYDFVVNAEL